MPAPGPATNAAIEAVVTTCPPSPCALIRGTNVTTPLTTPPRLTPSTQSQSWYVASDMSLKRLIPAFRLTTWTFPSTRSVSSAARPNASRSVTSSRIACTSPPSPAVASSRWSARTSATATFIPAATNALAMPSPTPLPPPVMKATLPSTSCMGSDLIGSVLDMPCVSRRPDGDEDGDDGGTGGRRGEPAATRLPAGGEGSGARRDDRRPGAASGGRPRGARGDRPPGRRRDRGDHGRRVPAQRVDRVHPDHRRPAVPPTRERLRVHARGVGLARPLEDGRGD